VQRVIKQWIKNIKLMVSLGFNQGFTQLCTANDQFVRIVTNKIELMFKAYADYSWNLDPIILFFEHLGNDDEEQQWANYRLNETPSKGVMMWGILTNDYNNLTRATVVIFQEWLHLVEVLHTLMGYAESHDEERLMYNNLQSGNSSASTHDVKTLSVALSRMSALGAVSLWFLG
jgi:hypothetical protein